MDARSVVMGRRLLPCGLKIQPVAIRLVLSALLFAAGCTTYPKLDEPHERPHLDISPLALRSDDGNTVLPGTVVELPGPAEVAAYDPEIEVLLVRFASGQDQRSHRRAVSRYAAFDVSRREVLWSAEGRPELVALRDGVAALAFEKGRKYKLRFVDALSGRYVGEEFRFPWFTEDGGLVVAEDYGASGVSHWASYVDATEGQVLWRTRLCDDIRRAFILDGWFYSVGLNCLDAIRLDAGMVWSLSTPTSNSGEALAKNLLVGAAGVAFAFVSPVTFVPSSCVFEHHFSEPLVTEDRVYFAGRERLFCLERETGDPIWEGALFQDHGSMRFVALGDAIALVASGFMLKSGLVVDGPEPLVMTFSVDDGEHLATFIPHCGPDEFVTGIRVLESKLYLLTTEHLFRIGPGLDLEEILDASRGDGWFVRFLSDEGPLLIRTQHGVIEVDESALKVRWRVELEGVPEDLWRPPSSILRPGQIDVVWLRRHAAEKDEAACAYSDSILWTWSDDYLYSIDTSVKDAEAARRVTRFPLAGRREFSSCGEGRAVTCVGSRAIVVEIDALQ